MPDPVVAVIRPVNWMHWREGSVCCEMVAAYVRSGRGTRIFLVSGQEMDVADVTPSEIRAAIDALVRAQGREVRDV